MKYLKNAIIVLLFFTPLVPFAQSNNDIIKNIQELMLENFIKKKV